MGDPETLAGRELRRRHPDVEPDEITELERQAHAHGVQAERQRTQRLMDRLREFLTAEQLGAASAVMTLDPDALAKLDDDTVRLVLDGLIRMPNPDPETRKAAHEATRRLLDEIM